MHMELTRYTTYPFPQEADSLTEKWKGVLKVWLWDTAQSERYHLKTFLIYNMNQSFESEALSPL